MDTQLGSNIITWIVIFPILAIVATAVIWFVIKINASSRTRIGLIVMGVFAFFGFSITVLGIYYHTNDPFSAGLKAYAYTALAPDYAKSSYNPENHDPFNLPENGYGSVLMAVEVAKQDGILRIPRNPSSGSTINGQLFTPGEWTTVNIDLDDFSITRSTAPETIQTSFWWALTKDIYNLEETIE